MQLSLPPLIIHFVFIAKAYQKIRHIESLDFETKVFLRVFKSHRIDSIFTLKKKKIRALLITVVYVSKGFFYQMTSYFFSP